MAQINYLQVTRKCNQNCRFCSNPQNTNAITLKSIKAILDKYHKDNVQVVIFTGGEPTLYNKLPEAIKYAAQLNIKAKIITNCQKISDLSYFKSLKDSGLDSINCSLFSCDPEVHEYITRTKGSFNKLIKALENAVRLNISTTLNTVINKYNQKELHILIAFIIKNFPFIKHFIFNNLDPGMDRVIEDPSTIPDLRETEVSLCKAMRLINSSGRTFRVERMPLCFMSEFMRYSTETRKIVKAEKRTTYFLDDKGLFKQDSWFYDKTDRCKACSVNSICAGVYKGNKFYNMNELCPVFTDIDVLKKEISEDY